MQLDTATEILDGVRPPKPKTVGEYRQAFLHHMEQTGRTEQPQTEPLKAGIDCGRWVVNCDCGGAIALHPDWQFAACFTCGQSWTTIEFPTPAFMKELTKILEQRPPNPLRRNDRKWLWSWWPSETLDDLRKENRDHNWQPPEETH